MATRPGSEQRSLANYRPIPEIRGLIGGPQRSGKIPFEPAAGDTRGALSRPYGNFKSNPWKVMSGHSPQNIAGALDDNDMHAGVERGIECNIRMKNVENFSHELVVTGDYAWVNRSCGQSSGSAMLQDVGSLNCLLRAGYEGDLLRWEELSTEFASKGNRVVALSEADLFGDRYYEKWVSQDDSAYIGDEGAGGYGFHMFDGSSDGNYASIAALEKAERGGDQKRPIVRAGKSNAQQTANSQVRKMLDRPINVVEISKTRFVADPSVETEQERIMAVFLKKQLDEESKMLKAASATRYRSLKFWKDKMGKSIGGLNYLYVGSVIDFWNPIGVVRSSSNDQGYANRLESNAPSTRIQGPTAVVTTCKKSHHIYNLWKSELEIEDKLYFVVKRSEIPKGSGNWGPIQIYPFSNGRAKPTAEDLYYVDFSNRPALGICVYVGYMSESTRAEVRPQQKRTMAAGLVPNCTPKDAYDARVGLDMLVTHVGLGDAGIISSL